MTEETSLQSEALDADGAETPVCIGCFRPVDPLAHYCPNCGAATGQFTHYLPFVNIRWQASVWGQAWRQMWSREVSLPGRLFRFFMIVWNAPVMLIGVLFKPRRETQEPPQQEDTTGSRQ